MTDVHEPKTRSYNMSQIRSKDTKPELIVRKFLHRKGLRFSLHAKDLPGKPDIKLTKYKTVVNVHGCFWHGHEDCEHFKMPKSNIDYWENKIYGNKERDKANRKKLKKMGWKVITFWECKLKKDDSLERLENLYLEIIKE
ncbi:very short patch repair endonuclease [Gracilimonas halophila]|uniref:Very short patch repair endonuclease n=1 Tax=Gracilimonas halophila TaxID=1834464 RepID=A0ABW5JF30_9BACT